MKFELHSFDPCPLPENGFLDSGNLNNHQLIALDIQSKYFFVDQIGQPYHEYLIPNNPDIQNCGSYIDKIVLYRDPKLFKFLLDHGISRQSFLSPEANQNHSILKTRSPQLDLLLFALIQELIHVHNMDCVSLFDLGCTVAEHWDLLDTMLRASSGGLTTANQVLSYCGLDYSAMLLSMAHFLHLSASPDNFRLVQAEGSNIDFPNNYFDLSLTVGVVNHVLDPMQSLKRMLEVTKWGAVLAIWITLEDSGYWAINHSGRRNYFFSRGDLLELETTQAGGHFWVVDYIPECSSTQQKSYIGLGQEKTDQLGSLHVVYSVLDQLPFEAELLISWQGI